MELKLYNTLTRTKEAFRPLDPARVRMYVCGPTVYDFAHIGNARPLIVFDVLFRLLCHLYGTKHVRYVRNITDVDDKINMRALEEYPKLPLNKAIRKITIKTEAQFHKDVAALRCLRPTVEPRATMHIKEMKSLIGLLIKAKRAYVFKSHVLFKVKGLRGYGKLSHRTLSEMRKGARGEVAPKRNPMDFVLWKPSKVGEPAWPSPARIKKQGRPGWHIECSAMSWKYLGETFDIHGGGIDLVFPHHENELAQSRCAFHTPIMAQVWMHNGFLQVEGEKMSKSLGNFVTIRELLADWPGPAIRLAMLMTHYTQPINWTGQKLGEAHQELHKWSALYGARFFGSLQVHGRKNGAIDLLPPSLELVDALRDDLNTPQAIHHLRQLFQKIEQGDIWLVDQHYSDAHYLGLTDQLTSQRYALFGQAGGSVTPAVAAFAVKAVDKLRVRLINSLSNRDIIKEIKNIGLDVALDDRGYFSLSERNDCTGTILEKIRRLVEERAQARRNKDWTTADRIRDELATLGIAPKDTAEGTPTWTITR